MVHADKHLEDYVITESRVILFLKHFHLSNSTSHSSTTYICFLLCASFLYLVLVVCAALIESSTSQVIITHTEERAFTISLPRIPLLWSLKWISPLLIQTKTHNSHHSYKYQFPSYSLDISNTHAHLLTCLFIHTLSYSSNLYTYLSVEDLCFAGPPSCPPNKGHFQFDM